MKRLIVLLGVAGVSLSAVFVRWSTAPSLILALYRMAFSAALMAVPVLAGRRRELKSLTRRDVLLCLASGLFLGIHFAAYFGALRATSIASAVVLVDTEVFFVAAASALFLGQRLPRRTWPAVLLAFAGRQRRRDECAAGRFDCPGRRRRHGGLYHDRNGLPAAALHVSVHLSGVYVRRGHAAGCGPAERNAAGRLRSGERADGPGHGGMLHPAGTQCVQLGAEISAAGFHRHGQADGAGVRLCLGTPALWRAAGLAGGAAVLLGVGLYARTIGGDAGKREEREP